MTKVKVNIKDKVLQIEKGKKKYKFEIKKISERLSKATDEELKDFTVSPSGYGIHWYKIDEDISIPSLLNEPTGTLRKERQITMAHKRKGHLTVSGEWAKHLRKF